MSADSGNEVPDDERLEWLLSLDDDQFKRMQKVARGPVYTRRQIAKYLGTGAAAALAGGASTGAVAADASTSDSDGNVGTPSSPVDVFADAVNDTQFVRTSDDFANLFNNASDNDHIYLLPGTHEVSSYLNNNSATGITLTISKGATLKMADGADNPGLIESQLGPFEINGSGTLDVNAANQSNDPEGIRIRDAATQTPLEGATVEGVTIRGYGNNGVMARNTNDFTVRNVTFVPGNTGSKAIHWNNTLDDGTEYESIRYQDNTVEPHGRSDSGDVLIIDHGSNNVLINDVRVTGNHIKAPWSTNQSGTNSQNAMTIHGQYVGVTVSDNVMVAEANDGTGSGISINDGSPNDCKDVAVSGNVIVGSGDSNSARGIATGAPNVTVTGNVAVGFDQAGIEVANPNTSVVGNHTDSISDGTNGSAIIGFNGLDGDHFTTIEFGSVSHANPGTASDGTWDTFTEDTQSVSFSNSFNSTPTVVATVEQHGDTGTHSVENVSASGFTSQWFNFASGEANGPTVYWVAIE